MLLRSSSITVVALLLHASPVFAQVNEASSSEDTVNDGAIEDIVVTARKRGQERLQDVPATIQALSGDTLAKMGVTSFEGFAYHVPGLTFVDQGPGLKRYTLRGIQSAGQEQVAVYYDEVPVPGIQSSTADSGSQIGDLNLYDMDRIEVLKGPQGTTFGANSQTGAIRFIARKPDLSAVSGSVKLDASTLAHGDPGASIYGMVNVPLVYDKLALRVVGFYDRTGGYVDNVRLGDDNINSDNAYGVRALLRFQPTNSLTVDGMVWLQNRDTNGAPDYFPGGYNDAVPTFEQTPYGEFNSGLYVKTPRPDRQRIYSLTASQDLGFGTLTLAGSIYTRRIQYYKDNSFVIAGLGVGPDGALCPVNTANPDGKPCVRGDLFPNLADQTQSINQKTLEARINSSGTGPFQWVTGVFYRDRKSDFISFVPVVNAEGVPFDPGYPPTGPSADPGAGIEGCLPCVLARENGRSISEQAVFGEATYDVTPWLELMGGLRWFQSKQHDVGNTSFNFPLAGAALPPAYDRTFKEDRVIKKVQVSIKPTDDISMYAIASQGYRLGGTNPSSFVAVPDGFNADSLWNYEIGLKTSWLENRLIVNAAVYQVDWSNIQVAGRTPTNFFFIGNAGAARIQGAELEVRARVAGGLELGGGLNWLPKRELSEDQVNSDIAAPGLRGDKIPRIPAFTANASVQYTTAIAGDWDGFIRGDYSYKGKANTELRATTVTRDGVTKPADPLNRVQRAYSLVNMRIGANNEVDGLGVSFYVNNLFDVAGDVFLAAAAYTPTTKITNRPRTIGIEITKTF